MLVDILRGTQDKTIKENRLEQLSGYGKLSL